MFQLYYLDLLHIVEQMTSILPDGCTEIISPDDVKIIEDKGDDDLQTIAGNSAHAEPGKKRKHDEVKDNVKRQRKDSETFRCVL